MVPLALASGWLLLQDEPRGYLLTGLTLTFAFMMCLSIPAWILVPLLQDGQIRPIEAVPFLLICAVGMGLALLFVRNLRSAAGPRATRS